MSPVIVGHFFVMALLVFSRVSIFCPWTLLETSVSPNSIAFWADYLQVVEDTSILSAEEMYVKESSF